MNPSFRSHVKERLLGLLRELTGRQAVLLPREAADDASLLSLEAPYRVEGGQLTVHLLEEGPGLLSAELCAYDGHFPSKAVWSGPARLYARPCDLTLDLETGDVVLDTQGWGRVSVPLPTRRFCWRLVLTRPGGQTLQRMTGHYRPAAGAPADATYFTGDNYVDHEAQTAGDCGDIVGLLRQHAARSPVLEIGCATGALLAALDRAGFQSMGVDRSEWAIAEAAKRLGPDRGWVCDVERAPLPAAICARRPYGAIVLAAILEHFHQPFATLAQLADVAAAGTVLVVTTTNADSLTHVLFREQWEGYFDATHHGIDQVSAQRLRAELPRLGWRITQLTTQRIWDSDAEPTRATLRDWWAADARFRRLLSEHDLGDLITCVAVRE